MNWSINSSPLFSFTRTQWPRYVAVCGVVLIPTIVSRLPLPAAHVRSSTYACVWERTRYFVLALPRRTVGRLIQLCPGHYPLVTRAFSLSLARTRVVHLLRSPDLSSFHDVRSLPAHSGGRINYEFTVLPTPSYGQQPLCVGSGRVCTSSRRTLRSGIYTFRHIVHSLVATRCLTISNRALRLPAQRPCPRLSSVFRRLSYRLVNGLRRGSGRGDMKHGGSRLFPFSHRRH